MNRRGFFAVFAGFVAAIPFVGALVKRRNGTVNLLDEIAKARERGADKMAFDFWGGGVKAEKGAMFIGTDDVVWCNHGSYAHPRWVAKDDPVEPNGSTIDGALQKIGKKNWTFRYKSVSKEEIAFTKGRQMGASETTLDWIKMGVEVPID